MLQGSVFIAYTKNSDKTRGGALCRAAQKPTDARPKTPPVRRLHKGTAAKAVDAARGGNAAEEVPKFSFFRKRRALPLESIASPRNSALDLFS